MENAWLKKMVAEQMLLAIEGLKELLQKMVTPATRRVALEIPRRKAYPSARRVEWLL